VDTAQPQREQPMEPWGNAGRKRTISSYVSRRVPRGRRTAGYRSRRPRHGVWSWLEAALTWLNHEYIWDVADYPAVLATASSYGHHPWLRKVLHATYGSFRSQEELAARPSVASWSMQRIRRPHG
jgi:hypothetical protein